MRNDVEICKQMQKAMGDIIIMNFEWRKEF